jgi:hypothetical protein
VTSSPFRSLLLDVPPVVILSVPVIRNSFFKFQCFYSFQFPSDSDAWLRIESEFAERWNFPHCVGAIDGKHVTIQAPPSSGSFYYNYKGFHSIVLMAMVDAKYRFVFLDVGCNGRVADGGIFARSSLSRGLQNDTLHLPPPDILPGRTMKVPFVTVADDAFPLRDNIMKPYPFREIPGAMRIFNY